MNGFILKVVTLTLALLTALASSLVFPRDSLPARSNHNTPSITLDANKKTIASVGCMGCHQRPSIKNNTKVRH